MKFIVHRSAFIVALLLCVSPAFAVKAPQIFTTSLPAGQNAVAYSATVKAKFGTKPYTWSIASGSLPTGLTIGAATGIISGTPTVNNTFAFTVRVTDSEGPPKTDDQGLFITITGAAPAPTPAVSVTTGSLPSGQVSIAYTTTLQATGGTAPYTWSITSCSGATGCLPAGLSLAAATGVVSGTPSAPGTYSFTIKVTDSSATAQTYSVAYAVPVAASPGAALFSDTFESGNFSAWTQTHGSVAVVGSPVYAGAKAMQATYSLCGDSTNPACGAAHQDSNNWVLKVLPEQTHFFWRGFVRFHTNAGGTPLAGIGRKLFYTQTSGNLPVITFGTTIGESSGLQYRALALSISTAYGGTFCGLDTISTRGAATCSGLAGSSRTTTQYFWAEDAWYYVEFEVLLNTPAASGPYDGEMRGWAQKMGVDPSPVLLFEATGVNLRGANTGGIVNFYVGMQADRQNWQAIDEIRGWDSIEISTTGPIGP